MQLVTPHLAAAAFAIFNLLAVSTALGADAPTETTPLAQSQPKATEAEQSAELQAPKAQSIRLPAIRRDIAAFSQNNRVGNKAEPIKIQSER